MGNACGQTEVCLNTIADFVELSLVCVVPEDPCGGLRMCCVCQYKLWSGGFRSPGQKVWMFIVNHVSWNLLESQFSAVS